MSHIIYKMKNIDVKKMPVKLIYVTRSEYDKDWHSIPHSHPFTELFYIVKGKGYFLLPNRQIPVKENDLVIINPFIDHTEKSNQQDSLEYIAFGIEGIAFTYQNENELQQEGFYIYQGYKEDILFYLNKWLDEVKNGNKEYEVVCQNIIEILIIKLERERKLKVEKSEPKRINKDIAFIKQYINKNYRLNITLDQLADLKHLNKYYLAHSFKNNVGISPIEYLNQVRIREAQTLLETTDYNIADISSMIGFSSQSYFTQTFRRHVNKTPSQYRKQMKMSG